MKMLVIIIDYYCILIPVRQWIIFLKNCCFRNKKKGHSR